MTTSISNVSAQAPDRTAAAQAATETTKPPPPLVEIEQTWASRLVFLTLTVAVVLSTLAFGTVDYFPLAIFQAGAALIVVLWALDAWRTGRLRMSGNSLQWPLAGLILLGLIQLLPLGGMSQTGGALTGEVRQALSLDPYATRLVLIQLVALLIYFAAALSFTDSPARLRTLVRTIIIFGFALAFFSIIQSLISPTRIYGLREPRLAVPFGPFVNRHNFAAYMEMTLALPLGLLFSGAVESEKRLLYLTAIGLMGVALLMSSSRGGLISLVAMVFFLVILTGLKSQPRGLDGLETEGLERTRHIVLRVGLAFALLIVLAAGALMIGGETSMSRFVDTVNASDPTTGRTNIWRVTLDVIKSYPLIGAGLGAYGVAYTPLDTSNGVNRPEQAHNDYLQVLADAGIIGAILGIFFIAMLFRMALRRRQSQDLFRRGVATGALAGCFALLVHSLFDFTLHTMAVALLFLVMAALATVNGRVEHAVVQRRSRLRSDDEFEDVYELAE